MSRRVWVLLLTAFMILAISAPVFAADWVISADGTYDISAYGNNSVITINPGLEVTLTNTPPAQHIPICVSNAARGCS